ncbi:MAG: LysM peptidoglycan-binding domain-containing protein [Dehalococcoidia bacterium]|nr:LysM peptidoglycan-binding domain-containing protein [Dehalococcoidia bacterium]
MDFPDPQNRILTRRTLFSRGGLAVAAGILGGVILRRPRVAHAGPAGAPPPQRHLSWVWQFSEDGAPETIRPALAAAGLGVVIKTHDGVDWMDRFDPSPSAVSGPEKFAKLVRFFEDGGVPVHAWFVAKGYQPLQEAKMAAQVVAAGARSVSVDLEPHPGFWGGGPQEALLFGKELRRLQPNAWLSVSVDPRPWHLPGIPLKEFAGFSNEIAPQVYWDEFNTPANWEHFVASGFPPGVEGITAAFLVDVTFKVLQPYGLPIHLIGQANAVRSGGWQQLLDRSYSQGIHAVSLWRHGLTRPETWQALQLNPVTNVAGGAHVYVVQPGDTLSSLAAKWGVSVDAVMDTNGISDPNYIYVGQVLKVPQTGTAAKPPPVSASEPAGPAPNRPPVVPAGPYVVQPGDTLTWLAFHWGTTPSRIAEVNALANPDLIWAGMKLLIP